MFTKFFTSVCVALSLSALVFAQEQTAPAKAPVAPAKPAAAASKKPVTGKKSDASGKKQVKAEEAAPSIVALNKASASELESLPGVGPAIAARIVSYRDEQGKFSELSELMNVKGIGEKKLAQLRPYLTLD